MPLCLPPNCVCGSNFTVEHVLNCKCGGFPSIRHNELRNITADLLTETSSDIMMEPPLQPLSGEVFKVRTTITEDKQEQILECLTSGLPAYVPSLMYVSLIHLVQHIANAL